MDMDIHAKSVDMDTDMDGKLFSYPRQPWIRKERRGSGG